MCLERKLTNFRPYICYFLVSNFFCIVADISSSFCLHYVTRQSPCYL